MAAPSAHRAPTPRLARLRTIAVVVVLLAVAVLAGVKLAAPSRSAPPTVASASLPMSPSSSGTPSLGTPSAVPTIAPTTPPAPPPPPRYVFPVQADANSPNQPAYARTHAEYPAADILAACGTPVVAVTDGVVLEVNRVDRWDPVTDDGAWRGGKFLSILGDDGVRYYGGHFSLINAGVEPGVRLAAGQSVGQVGTTGSSGACHLHFGISPPCGATGDWWNRRGVIWPWSYLDAWRAGTSTSAVAEIAAWKAGHGCPTAPDPNFP